MTYEEAISYIHNTLKFGIKPGLERIEELMRRLGDPQTELKAVHIAGTNGKGSTATMISSSLTAAGYKTGLFTSPYIVDFRERIQIDGEYITHEALACAVEKVKTAAEAMTEDGYEHPTEFELITAAAFICFKNEKCDYVVLETGLGGRLDSTNVIKSPKVCVVTSISMDHMNVLGGNIELIAKEKAGIIKKSADVIEYPYHSDKVRSIILKAAEDVGADLFTPDLKKLEIISEDLLGSDFIYDGLRFRVNLTGRHQVYNAVTAICAISRLKSRGARITYNDMVRGIGNAKIPGRFEVIGVSPKIILDGGHNADGVGVLCDTLEALSVKKPVVIMGMLGDKEYEKCISKVAALSGRFIAVDIDNPRALKRGEVKRIAMRYTRAYEAELSDAISMAKDFCGTDGTILICGSLYLVSQARELLLRRINL